MSLIENLCITNIVKPLLMGYLFESKFNIMKFEQKNCDRLIGFVVDPLITMVSPQTRRLSQSLKHMKLSVLCCSL